MLTTSGAARDILAVGSTIHACTAWWIRLTNGERYFWTDHDYEFWFPYEGASNAHLYAPEGALTRSNVRTQAGGEDSTELSGVISAGSGVTRDDIRVGKWRDARVYEFVVPWRYPDAGALFQAVYNVGYTEHTAIDFTFEALGIASRMKRPVGRRVGPKCHWILGAAFGAASNVHGCRANVAAKRIDRVEVATVDATNRIITAQASTLPSTEDAFYDEGYAEWITGENAGVPPQEVKIYTDSTRTIEFILEHPFDIEVGDLFNLRPGCNHLKIGCVFWEQFPNIFGGQSFTPSQGELRSPPHRGEHT